MTSVSLDRIASALGLDKTEAHDTHIWATVASVNTDGSYQVTLNGASVTTRAARLCNASVGDRVFCVVSNGQVTAIGRVGGDFPIGYIYLSFTNVSPASLFGGTWEQLTNVFLRAANDTSTGGSDTHTLTTSEMPSHTHGYSGEEFTNYDTRGSGSTNLNGSSGSWSPGHWFSISSTGGGQSHNNMPAYQDVYAWRRTA